MLLNEQRPVTPFPGSGCSKVPDRIREIPGGFVSLEEHERAYVLGIGGSIEHVRAVQERLPEKERGPRMTSSP